MNQIVWDVVRQSDMPVSEIEKIATLKDEHWPHGINSQIMWIKKNLNANDIHLLARAPNGILQAYLSLVNVEVSIDGNHINMIGLGNVCVGKSAQGKGYGLALVRKANGYIKSRDSIGILLCKDSLVPFYTKCGWSIIKYRKATVSGSIYMNNVMTTSALIDDVTYLEIMRNF